MSDKKQLNEEQLEKASGGNWNDFEIGKFYCLCFACKNLSYPSSRIGPYDTLSEAKDKGLEWAIDMYNNGYTDIEYSTMKWDYSGWNVYNTFTYPE